MQFQPKDIVALAAILVTGGLMIAGENSLITALFAAVIVAYVGIDFTITRRKK